MVFFFNDPPPSEIFTLPLPAALPISTAAPPAEPPRGVRFLPGGLDEETWPAAVAEAVRRIVAGRLDKVVLAREDRKSTRLNSSHANISHAVFCLKTIRKRSQ